MTVILAAAVIVPLVAAGVGLVPGSRRGARLAAVGGALVATGVTLLELSAGLRQGPVAATRPFLPAPDVGELTMPLQLVRSGPVATIAVVVAVVTLAVQAFAAWYLDEDDRYPVFAVVVSLFAAAMQLLVHSGDLVLTLVGWEVMGWCSYLLIGHWSRTRAARRAAHKAFLVTRVADIAMVLGLVVLAAGAGTTSLPQVVSAWTSSACAAGADCGAEPLRAVAMVLVVIGVLGKSAQAPFQDWLPDAMRGPTPASALIHAATMVAAGTLVLSQLGPILAASGAARWVLAASVSITMVGGAALAWGQRDLKALLAWSTVSQVAIMLAPFAVLSAEAAAGAGLFHLYSHAFFKALLFLAVGWASVIAGSTLAARLSGTGHADPVLAAALVIGWSSLAGLPLFAGGWSKELVLSGAIELTLAGSVRAGLVTAALLVTIVLTAAYSTHALLVLLPRVHRRRAWRGAATATPGARWPVLALTVLTVASVGILVVGRRALGISVHLELGTLVLTVVLIGFGALLGAARRPGPAPRVEDGLGADGLYTTLVAQPVLATAVRVQRADSRVIDAAVTGIARSAGRWGEAALRAHRAGRPSIGMLGTGLGLVVLLVAGALGWALT